MKPIWSLFGCLLLLFACTVQSTKTHEAAAPLSLVVENTPVSFSVQAIPPDTQRIEAKIYDNTGRELANHTIVANQTNQLAPIPAGNDRKIVVKAYNQVGKVVAYGEKSGINVLTGGRTPTQTIRLSYLSLEGVQPKDSTNYLLDFGPADQRKRVSLKNTGDFPLAWKVQNVSTNLLWMGASNLSGGHTSTNSLKSQGSDTITVDVDRNGLSFGKHQGLLKITADKIEQPLLVDVNMDVSAASTATTTQGSGRGSISGKVVNRDTGTPIPGASVVVGITEDEIIGSTTDNQGQFLLSGVPEGTRVVVVSASGKSTRLEVTVVEAQVRNLGNVSLAVYNGSPVTTKPLIRINQPTTLRGNQISGNSPIVTIAGTITGLDTDPPEAVISINGEQAKIGVNADGTFSYVAVLTKSGLNKIFVNAINTLGSSRSELIEVTYNKPKIDVHVRLNWDTNITDIDLHVLDPRGNQTYYSQKNGIPNSQLDVDDTNGYGPENFTMLTLPTDVPGRYKVGVIYFSTHGKIPPDTKCLVDVILKEGSEQEVVKRYERVLSVGSGGSVFPTETNSTYWRVADFIVNADGSVAIVSPGG